MIQNYGRLISINALLGSELSSVFNKSPSIFGSFRLVKISNGVLMLINQKEVNMLYDEYVVRGNYLAHHGVKGQKWGVRRERKKYTPVKVPKFSKDPIGYGVAKAKNFAFTMRMY